MYESKEFTNEWDGLRKTVIALNRALVSEKSSTMISKEKMERSTKILP